MSSTIRGPLQSVNNYFTACQFISLTHCKPRATLASVEYVTIKKAAEMLGVSRPTVYKLIAEGKIKTREFVGRPAIAVSEIAKRKVNGKAK